jgi:peptidyl-prolyl cis-trans isomerase C
MPSTRILRRSLICSVLLLLPVPGHTQPAPPNPEATGLIVATVEGRPITLSELGHASESLPVNLRGLPFDTVYPALLDRMVDHAALVMMARRAGLETSPELRQAVPATTDLLLEAAYLRQEVAPKVTEQAIRARYDQLSANHPPEQEVHARHILVATEVEARAVLNQLRRGGDFATVARALSMDRDASGGGDLGFFRRDQVWPGFAEVAFALSPGQVASDPIRNEFGWHVVMAEASRTVPTPSFAEAHDGIRRDLLAGAARQAIVQARSQLLIHRFNLDGTEIDAGPMPSTRPDPPGP